VFKSWTRQTKDEKLSLLFGWLNGEGRGLVYIVEQHSHARQALFLGQSYCAVLMFAFRVRRSNLIRSKESKRVDIYFRQLRLLAGSLWACMLNAWDCLYDVEEFGMSMRDGKTVEGAVRIEAS
jgi:hypothetical protein